MGAFQHLYYMKGIFLIGWLIVFLLPSTFAQRHLSRATAEIVNAIAINNKYESQFVGFAGSPSVQYQNYERLKNIATNDELVHLLKHKSAAVRIYSFKTLYEKDPGLAKKLSAQLLADTSEFMSLQGCIAGTEDVKSFVQRILRNRY